MHQFEYLWIPQKGSSFEILICKDLLYPKNSKLLE